MTELVDITIIMDHSVESARPTTPSFLQPLPAHRSTCGIRGNSFASRTTRRNRLNSLYREDRSDAMPPVFRHRGIHRFSVPHSSVRRPRSGERS